jgi:hypothetical protein
MANHRRRSCHGWRLAAASGVMPHRVGIHDEGKTREESPFGPPPDVVSAGVADGTPGSADLSEDHLDDVADGGLWTCLLTSPQGAGATRGKRDGSGVRVARPG